MMAHLSAQIKVALGDEKMVSNVFGKLFGKMIKKKILDEKPYSRNLPTSSQYLITISPVFNEAKTDLINLINRFEAHSLSKDTHPMFGPMTVDEWGISTWKHIDHHLNQFGV